MTQSNAGGSYNLGSGTGFSVKEILSAISIATGKPVPDNIKGRRAGDPSARRRSDPRPDKITI
jgi:UDP-glucose 4-epimerase